MSVTHLAGPVVGYKGRSIQRCALCGEKLRDSKGEAAPMNEDGTIPEYPMWTVSNLIRFMDDGFEVDLGEYATSPAEPDDFCIALVED